MAQPAEPAHWRLRRGAFNRGSDTRRMGAAAICRALMRHARRRATLFANSGDRIGEHVMTKAKSKKQQMAAGAALSAKRGNRPKSSLKGASKGMVDSMDESQLEDMAETKRKDKPERAGGKA